MVVRTAGREGGTWETADGRSGRYGAVQPPPARPGVEPDAYGCGDSFAAGLTYALGAGLDIDASLRLAARCGAECAAGAGPYQRQLTAAAL
jgi:ribokinase